jgi:penicillin-binding protein 1C
MSKNETYRLMRRVAFWTVVVSFCGFVGSVFLPFPADRLAPISVQSLRVEDDGGRPLRTFLNDQQGRGQWRGRADIAQEFFDAVIAAEDRRFFWHPGVDPLAVIRAAWTNALAGSVRSGGSTITQQLVRTMFLSERSLVGKMREAWLALRLERSASKEEILVQYANRAPFGNQLFGVEAASQQYFDKPARELSLAEAAYLAALPNAPTSLNPYRYHPSALERQRSILRKMLMEERIDQAAYNRALLQPVNVRPASVVFRAPHAAELARALAASYPDAASLRTTIDGALQANVEGIIRANLRRLASMNVTNAALLVIENATGNIKALVGSADYFDETKSGQVNGVCARRQPGSAMKAFTYALAFEAGASPADVIPDIPLALPDREGEYVPENYDRRYHGPVRLRTALACSYNIPAVRLLRSIGIDQLWQRLPVFGFSTITEPASHYGFGLTLGNADVTLFDLTNAYASFARSGLWKPAVLVEQVKFVDGRVCIIPTGTARRSVSERAAFLLTDVLSDPSARRPAFGNAFRFPFPCAVKTGTTKDYRDNWTVGYSSEYTVGVWVGNFDGSPMRGVSGVAGAGPIFIDVMQDLFSRGFIRAAEICPVPEGMAQQTVCSVSGGIPGPYCRTTIREWNSRELKHASTCRVHRAYWLEDHEGNALEQIFVVLPPEYHDWMTDQRIPQPPRDAVEILPQNVKRKKVPMLLAIVSPNNGDRFRLDPVLRREYQSIRIKPLIPDGLTKALLQVDGKDAGFIGRDGTWWTLEPGEHRFRLCLRSEQKATKSREVLITVE